MQDQILKTFESIKSEDLSAQRLEGVKSNLKYSLALRMDSSEAIAETLAHYVQLKAARRSRSTSCFASMTR